VPEPEGQQKNKEQGKERKEGPLLTFGKAGKKGGLRKRGEKIDLKRLPIRQTPAQA